MSITQAIKVLMQYVSVERIQLQDLYNSNNLELSLPQEVYNSLVLLDEVSSHSFLLNSNGKVVINPSWKSAKWVNFLRKVKHSTRFSDSKFHLFACRLHGRDFYFFEFRGSNKKERLVYTV